MSKYNPYVPLLIIDTAHDCAWRAVYISGRRRNACGEAYSAQIAHVGIDPTAAEPGIFGGVAWGRRYVSFRVAIPLSNQLRAFLLKFDGRSALHTRRITP